MKSRNEREFQNKCTWALHLSTKAEWGEFEFCFSVVSETQTTPRGRGLGFRDYFSVTENVGIVSARFLLHRVLKFEKHKIEETEKTAFEKSKIRFFIKLRQ